MKTNILYLLALLLSFSVNAQTSHQAFTAAGGDASHSSGSIAFSIGQVFYTSSASSTGSTISQGVQQVRKSITTLFLDLNVLIDGYYINQSNPPLMVPALVGSYYIVLKHRSCLPLWSASPISFTNTTEYNFIQNVSNAYGIVSPPVLNQVAPGVFALFSGELNDDGYIDGMDYVTFETDLYSSAYGDLFLLDGDFNGDSYVDASDFSKFDYNSQLGLYYQRPY